MLATLVENPIFIQAAGLFASAIIVFSYTQKSDDHLKYFAVLGNLVFATHFLLLGAYAGMAISIMNCFRIYLSVKFHRSNYMMFFFMFIYIAMALFIAEKWIDFFPAIASLVGTYSMYKLSGIKFRMVGLLGSSAWLSYSIFYFSIGGVITEVFAITINLITIKRLAKRSEKTERPIP